MARVERLESAELVGEWKPGRNTWFAWLGLGMLMLFVGVPFYLSLEAHTPLPSSMELPIVPALLLTFVVAALHEAIHGLAMLPYGARPTFGILRGAGLVQGFYTTADGHRFTRTQYLVMALAPSVVLIPLSVPLVWSPIGWALWVPFAVHLSGCIGDWTIAARVAAAPSGCAFEDLRDGFRIWRRASLG